LEVRVVSAIHCMRRFAIQQSITTTDDGVPSHATGSTGAAAILRGEGEYPVSRPDRTATTEPAAHALQRAVVFEQAVLDPQHA
jgi:hypothetical protein